VSNNKNRLLIIGLGYVGIPLLIESYKSGFNIYGLDTDLNSVRDKLKDLNFANLKSFEAFNKNQVHFLDYANLYKKTDSKFDIIVICVPTPLLKSKPDLRILTSALNSVRKIIRGGELIIIESTIAPNTVRNLAKQKKFGHSTLKLDIAFSPERIDPLNQKWDVKNTPKLVAGLTDKARDRAVEFYSKFIDTVIPCSSLEVAETAKLLENSFRLINISFINELAIFCNKIGIDVQEVIKAASTKPYGFMPFYPSVGIGGHCIPVDPVYLSHKAKEVGAPTSFIDLATKVNHEMPKYFVKRASQMLGKVKNKKVLVLGVSYKPNISDVRETPVEALIDGLRKKGAKVKWHDDIVKKWRGEKSAEITDKYDLAIIATPHDYFDLKKLGKTKILNTRSSI
jgi:UDP-N-acetyl-D-glucosamine dehydrogenase